MYSSDDIKLLSMISDQTSIVIEKIGLKEDGLKKEKEIIEERERISREIHDGIGAIFINAIMFKYCLYNYIKFRIVFF